MATRKYHIDYETAIKASETTMSGIGGLPHHYSFYPGTPGNGGQFWVVGSDPDPDSSPTPHSGSRCVGHEITDRSLCQRVEYVVENVQNIAGHEIYAKSWVYLPSDWWLYSSNKWSSHMVFQREHDDPWLPYWAFHIGIFNDQFTANLAHTNKEYCSYPYVLD